MERANVISKLKKGVDLNIIKKVKNKYGKLSYRINKDAIKESKVSNTAEIIENDDTLSYIDKMYEEVKYKALKEKLLDELIKHINWRKPINWRKHINWRKPNLNAQQNHLALTLSL